MNKEKLREHLANCCPIIFFSALTGVFSGIVVILYSFVAEFLSHSSKELYQKVAESPAFIPLLFLALVILAFISYVIIRFLPEAKGTGFTADEAKEKALSPISWWRTMIGTILGSFVSFFGGLSFGVEGPATAIGFSLGNGISKLYKSKKAKDRQVNETKELTAVSGFSAAITAAFSAPITGVIFTLEELDKKFSPYVFLATSCSVIASFATSIGLRTLLGMEARLLSLTISPLPFSHYWTLLLLGLACGICAIAFSKAIRHINEISILKRIPLVIKLIVAYLLTGVAGLFLVDAIGSGTSLIKDLVAIDFKWWILIVLLIVKSILTIIAKGSESIGGLLLPTMTIGALIGALMGKVFIQFGVPAEYYVVFIIVGISAFLGATLRTPITAVILVIEITASASNSFAIALTVLISFILSELFNSQSKPEELL